MSTVFVISKSSEGDKNDAVADPRDIVWSEADEDSDVVMLSFEAE